MLDANGQDVEVVYDDDCEANVVEELGADNGPLLMLRHSCLAPRAEFPQRNNLFHSRCTINGKVCTFIIDSGSCENVVADTAMTKLELKSEPRPSPYKLSWLQQGSEVCVTHRALVFVSRWVMLIKIKYIVMLFLWMRVTYCWEDLGNLTGVFNMMVS